MIVTAIQGAIDITLNHGISMFKYDAANSATAMLIRVVAIDMYRIRVAKFNTRNISDYIHIVTQTSLSITFC